MKFPNLLFSVLLITMLHPLTAVAQFDRAPDTLRSGSEELILHPVIHGSLILENKGINVYIDPNGPAGLYEGKGDPDLILITHPHGDHLNLETLGSLNTAQTTFIVPQAVYEELPSEYRENAITLANDETTKWKGLEIKAVPMYNLPEEGARHAKGWGNGYLIEIGGQRVYISGDTEDIAEMRALEGIDVAFVCMNLPYTMDIQQASSAVLDFKPRMVYPYHHRGQDIKAFKALVDQGNTQTKVRLKNWYPAQ